MSERDDVVDRYRRYLAACNRRDWVALGTHVADTIRVNGVVRTREQYIADVVRTVTVFPDYTWELQRTVVEGEWLAVRLRGTGTRMAEFLGAPGDGSRVETDELDLYRFLDGLIVEVEGAVDNARLRS
ncbi:ester cyclase [Desertihabitans brevis]|uniref:ester cyclase n=1 Tax=Desertihabitans brevis TaxID=2268447 RepID=UPI001314DC97|nr:ester cyclase [Desertihabitans brevis]